MPCARATPNAALIATITSNAAATGSSLRELPDLHAAALCKHACARERERGGSAAAGGKGAQAGMMDVEHRKGQEGLAAGDGTGRMLERDTND